jgi:alkanesulfonate monooxygenase SsuD/methylene tetrahydromethanopterin reductase-like flavin-dependent oxidoreductase (luciferase family)
MGGPRRTRAESVDALREAIDIIRGIWDTSGPGRLQRKGDHYDIPGAMRGPQPAHPISLWVPAEGPVARRLVGRKADGWITGAAWMTDVERQLAEGNQIIDEAAMAAARDSREIRRIFDFHGSFTGAGRGFAQGPAEQWVQQLLPLVVEHGISVFILIGDDPYAIERWGTEVGPALRDAVARERQSSELAKVRS